MPAPASTLAPNPLEESLAKITDRSVLSKTAGTSPIGYSDQGFRQPAADVINISGSPGMGATWAEQRAAESAAANLALQQAQFGYLQTQDVISNLLKQQEAQRAAEQLGLTKQTTASQLAAAQQQLQSGALGMQQTKQQMGIAGTAEARAAQQAALDAQVKQQQMALASSAEQRAIQEAWSKAGGLTPEQVRAGQLQRGYEYGATGGAPVGSPTVTAYRIATIPGYVPSPGEVDTLRQVGLTTAAIQPGSTFRDPTNYYYSSGNMYTAPKSTTAGQVYYAPQSPVYYAPQSKVY